MLNARIAPLLLVMVVVAPFSMAETLEFTRVQPGVGHQRADFSKMSMTMKVAVSLDGNPIQEFDQEQQESTRTRTTILEKQGGEVVKIRLECQEKTGSQTGPQGASETKSPLSGQTVVATMKDGEITITTMEGESVDSALEAAAREEARKKLGEPLSEFFRLLPDRPIEYGEVVEIDPEVARDVLSQGGDSALNDVALTLVLKKSDQRTDPETGKKEEVGVFDVKLTLAGDPSPGLHISAELTGELLLATATTWPILMELTGPLTVTGSQDAGDQKVEFSGGGPMELSLTASHTKAK